jgi:hypothetical protein
MTRHLGETMRRFAAILLVLGPRMLAAQWGISAEIGVARFSGTSRDSAGARVGPYRPTTFGIRVDRALGAVRLVIAATYAKTGLAGEHGGVAFVQYDVASLWEIAPAVSLRLARFGAGVTAWVEAGPTLDLWDIQNEPRSRVGGQSSLSCEWPLGGRFTGSLRLSGAVSRSMMNPEDAPPGVQRRATRRAGVTLGLRYRL